jgi:hypothetical protein
MKKARKVPAKVKKYVRQPRVKDLAKNSAKSSTLAEQQKSSTHQRVNTFNSKRLAAQTKSNAALAMNKRLRDCIYQPMTELSDITIESKDNSANVRTFSADRINVD